MEEQEYKNKLTDYIANRVSITQKERSLIEEAYSILFLKKKDFVFQQGEICQKECFVIKGTLRVFYIDQRGLEHVLYFAFSDWWVGDIASFNSNEPSGLNGQALEDSILLVIDPEKKDALLKQVPSLEKLFRIITQNHLTVLSKRFLLTVSSNVLDRYQELITRSPGIEQLVPQHQIASYLGILPESLSRMKKQMHK